MRILPVEVLAHTHHACTGLALEMQHCNWQAVALQLVRCGFDGRRR